MAVQLGIVRRLLFAGVLFILVTSCSEGTMQKSGIEGTVTIGPTCPEGQDNDDCPREPFETTLIIREAGTEREVATVESGADGTFRIELQPGEYIVEPDTPNQFVPPFAEPQDVTVQRGEFTVIEIFYDSGIRQ